MSLPSSPVVDTRNSIKSSSFSSSRDSSSESFPLLLSSSPPRNSTLSTRSWISTKCSEHPGSAYTSRTQSSEYVPSNPTHSSAVSYSSLERIKKRQRDGRYGVSRALSGALVGTTEQVQSNHDDAIGSVIRPRTPKSHEWRVASDLDYNSGEMPFCCDQEVSNSVIPDIAMSLPTVIKETITNSFLHDVKARTHDLMNALSTSDSVQLREQMSGLSKFRSQLEAPSHRKMKSHARTMSWACSLFNDNYDRGTDAQDTPRKLVEDAERGPVFLEANELSESSPPDEENNPRYDKHAPTAQNGVQHIDLDGWPLLKGDSSIVQSIDWNHDDISTRACMHSSVMPTTSSDRATIDQRDGEAVNIEVPDSGGSSRNASNDIDTSRNTMASRGIHNSPSNSAPLFKLTAVHTIISQAPTSSSSIPSHQVSLPTAVAVLCGCFAVAGTLRIISLHPWSDVTRIGPGIGTIWVFSLLNLSLCFANHFAQAPGHRDSAKTMRCTLRAARSCSSPLLHDFQIDEDMLMPFQ